MESYHLTLPMCMSRTVSPITPLMIFIAHMPVGVAFIIINNVFLKV